MFVDKQLPPDAHVSDALTLPVTDPTSTVPTAAAARVLASVATHNDSGEEA